jgi:hypothetical protein
LDPLIKSQHITLIYQAHFDISSVRSGIEAERKLENVETKPGGMSDGEPKDHAAETAAIPQTSKLPKVERITAADVPFLSADERRKWAERAIKEGQVFEYASGQWP